MTRIEIKMGYDVEYGYLGGCESKLDAEEQERKGHSLVLTETEKDL